MGAPLGPIEAGTTEDSLSPCGRAQIDTEIAQQSDPGTSQLTAVPLKMKATTPHQSGRHGDAELTRDVIVAGPRHSQRHILWRRRFMAPGPGSRDGERCLEHL